MRKTNGKFKAMNRKGSAEGTFFIIVMLVAFSFLLTISHFMYNEVSPEMKGKFAEGDIVSDNHNATVYEVMQTGEDASNIFDFVFVSLFVALFLGLLITSFLVDVHPIFLVVYLISAVLLVVISFPLSNAWIEYYNEAPAEIQVSLAEFPMTNSLMERLPYISIGLMLAGMVVLYAKSKSAGGGFV